MAERVVLVNGLPGSGKTTLATALADELAVPLISKDALKEALAAAVPQVPAAGSPRLRPSASAWRCGSAPTPPSTFPAWPVR